MKERKKPLKGSVVLIGHPMESLVMKALSHTPHTHLAGGSEKAVIEAMRYRGDR